MRIRKTRSIVGLIRVKHDGRIIERPVGRTLHLGKWRYYYSYNMRYFEVFWRPHEGKYIKKPGQNNGVKEIEFSGVR